MSIGTSKSCAWSSTLSPWAFPASAPAPGLDKSSAGAPAPGLDKSAAGAPAPGLDKAPASGRPMEADSGCRPPPPVVELIPRDLVVLMLESEEEEEEVALESMLRIEEKFPVDIDIL